MLSQRRAGDRFEELLITYLEIGAGGTVALFAFEIVCSCRAGRGLDPLETSSFFCFLFCCSVVVPMDSRAMEVWALILITPQEYSDVRRNDADQPGDDSDKNNGRTSLQQTTFSDNNLFASRDMGYYPPRVRVHVG